jgi:hypothetical protein
MKFKNLQKLLLLVVLLVFTNAIVLGGPRSKYGLSAAPELLIPVGSIGTSLSGSDLANVTGVEALYWNPAGMSNLSGKSGEVLFSHQKYIADININYFAGAYNIGSLGTIGLSVKALGFGDIEITTVDNPDGTGETYSPTYITAGLSFARAMTDRILFGATFKVISEKITNETASGMAVDLGLQYVVGKTGLKFGVALKNLGPSMKFDGTDLEQYYQPAGSPSGAQNQPRRITLNDFELPTSLSLALSYDLLAGKNNTFTFNGTFQNNSFAPDDYVLGLEYNFKKIFFLRGAYNMDQNFWQSSTRSDMLFGPTFGAGLRYDFGSFNVSFDYAYRVVKQSALASNQFFSLNMGF